MERTMLIFVSDDNEAVESARMYAQTKGVQFQTYTTSEWRHSLDNPNFKEKLTGEVPSLQSGSKSVSQMGGAKILPFPGGPSRSEKVQTINELESVAIENAIHQFNGNLTEAAKALGIGRATLYRKVKQYEIDPTSARKKRAA